MLKFRKDKRNGDVSGKRGFSLVELLVVLAASAVMIAVSIPYLLSYKTAYKTDDQSIKIIDLMSEASQLALTRRRTMRLEIDLTDNAVLIIDENGATHTLLKKIPLEQLRDVRVDVKPSGVSKPNPPNFNDAVYAVDTVGHKVGAATVTGHNIWYARFQRDGSVVNTAGTPISANIYVWPPLTYGSTSARSPKEIRAITLFGGSGAIKYWKYDGTNFVSK